MIQPIVHSTAPVTLVGAGDATAEDLQKSLKLAPLCVAADGGADLVLSENQSLEALIGDFDSVPQALLSRIPPARQHRVEEQTSTDFEKALLRIDAPLVVGIGFLGGRVDHQLAVFHSLTAFPHRPCLLLGQHEVICLAPPRVSLPLEEGDVVSLFPLGAVRGRSQGLQWPIDDIHFSPASRIGTSNRAMGPAMIEMAGPEMLLILPRHLMPALVAQLLAPEAARWPARAG